MAEIISFAEASDNIYLAVCNLCESESWFVEMEPDGSGRIKALHCANLECDATVYCGDNGDETIH